VIFELVCPNGKHKTESQAIFLNPLTVSSAGKRKFVVRPFVDEERREVIRLQTDLMDYTD
jgi:hypothetical protein